MQNVDVISLTLQLTISCLTLTCEWLKGNKWRHVWLFALAVQAVWYVWIVYDAKWGLLPLAVFLTVLNVRNHFKWRAERMTVFGQRICRGCETQRNCVAHGCKNRVDVVSPSDRAYMNEHHL